MWDTIQQNDFELLPFRAGIKMCHGNCLGLKVIQSSLANLLHGFTWKLFGNMSIKELNMDEVFKLLNHKKKFHLKLWFNQGFHPIFTTCYCLTKQQNYSARFAFKVPLVQFYLL